MKTKREVAKDIVVNIVIFLLFFNVLSFMYFFMYFFTTEGNNLFLWLLLVPFFLMLLIRIKVNNLPVFGLLHVVLIPAAVFTIGSITAWWIVLLFMVAAVFYSWMVKIHGECILSVNMVVLAGIFILLLYVFTGLMNIGIDVLHNQHIGSSIVILTCTVLYTHLNNLDNHISMAQRTDNRKHSVGSILAKNNILIIGFVIVVFIVGVFVVFVPVLEIFFATITAITDFFLPVLIPIFYFVVNIFNALFGLFAQTEEIEPTPLSNLGAIGNLATEYRNFPTTIFLFIVIVILAVALFIFLRYVYRFFKVSKEKIKKPVEVATADETTSLSGSILSDLRDLFPRFRSRSLNPVRRAYVKKVNKHIKMGAAILSRSDTTDVIADKIRSTENIDELTEKYEKARYGQE